jgi:hypothetical protein
MSVKHSTDTPLVVDLHHEKPKLIWLCGKFISAERNQ